MMKISVRNLPAARLLGLAVLLLASVALTLALEPGQGRAALGEQNSPLSTVRSPVSPLDGAAVSPLRTPTTTPTPTATSPIPPTAEPPAELRTWPTPTPTSYPSAVQAAVDSLTGDGTLNVADVELSAQLLVDDPVTNDELTVVRLSDRAMGTNYWLRSTVDGDAELLPDFGDDALALVAQAEKVDAADLQLSTAFYVPFPFTRQILWVAQVANSKSGTQYSITLNLAGQEVDAVEAAAAEAAVVLEYCGAMDVPLCLEIFDAPTGAESNVALVITDERDPEPVVAYLDEQAVVYRQDEESFYFRMENDALRALAHLENVEAVQKDYPDEVRSLDTNLIIGLMEQSGALSLTLESQKYYPLLNYRISATLEQVEVTQTQSITLLAQIDGIFTPGTGPSGQAPAGDVLPLGRLNGRYDLALTYSDPEREVELLDNYALIVSGGRAVLRAGVSSFTWPKYTTWLRLPGNAVWFVVHARSIGGDGQAIDVDPADFADKAAAFYAEVAALPAQELSLAQGVYTNALFVPPWPVWQTVDGDFVRVPVSESQSYLFKWPEIRYFTYTGQLSAVEDLIITHCVDEVAIVGYTASGDVLDVCQP